MASVRRDSRSGQYMIHFRYGGRQFQRSLKTKSRKRASAICGRVEETLQMLQLGRRELKDPDGSTVFDNRLITYGGGIRTNHMLRDTPTLVAGHGGGGVRNGRHYAYESNQTPLANLWLSMLDHVGIKSDRFADSDARLRGLFG